MKATVYYVIVFNSKNHAYLLESTLKKIGYKTIVQQVPNYLSKGCSLGLIIEDKDALKIALDKIKFNSLNIYKIYERYYDRDNSRIVYKVKS